MFGAALGDALGAPFEFRPAEVAEHETGSMWIDRLHTCRAGIGPHGCWQSPAPPGTGTDDTRYNWIFLELASALRRMPTAEEIAVRYLEVYESPETFFRDHADLAAAQFEVWEGACRGRLGHTSQRYPGVSPDVLRERSIGLNYPTLIGLITLTSAGLLYAGDPEKAYEAAFRADFIDIGYARECVALLAAAISLAVRSSARDAPHVLATATAIDPFSLGGFFGGPFAAERLRSRLQTPPQADTPQMLSQRLSEELADLHPFDPCKAMAIAYGASVLADSDPLGAILVAVNHRGFSRAHGLAGFQDIDCYGAVTGALVGALVGEGGLPRDLVAAVMESNRNAYGFDLGECANRFISQACEPGT